MIEEIRLENVGVIAQAHLRLAPSLTVITGETGAGKTMVLTGLGLLLGERADAAVVRPGAARAVVEGLVVAANPVVRAQAEEVGAELDDDALLLVRAVPAAGRSRAWMGGRAVPQAVLARVATELVTVHGQADQLRLRAPSQQRAALDAFAGGGHQEVLGRYREAFARRAAARAELDAWDDAAAAREDELARLRAGLSAVAALQPVAGEDVALQEESERLSHVEELREAVSVARAALSGGPDVPGVAPGGAAGDAAAAVHRARRALEQAAALDAPLAQWAQRLAEVGFVLDDVGLELSSYLADLEADPARLAAVHERRAALAELAGRYGRPGADGRPSVDSLLEWAGSARERVELLGDPAGARDSLQGAVAEADRQVAALAQEVSTGRREAAGRLADAVAAELAGLAMPGARLQVRLTPRAEVGPWGAEDVELLLSAHPGAAPMPLGRGASGGELSRVMLAVEVALATAADGMLPTFVFDEVDAGVGGRAAVEVGRRLAALGKVAQVVVVTHLAQVAAFAERHLVVTKTVRGGHDVVTDSDVRAVEGPDRVRELARMLSGQEDSQAALLHAEELLARAGVGA